MVWLWLFFQQIQCRIQQIAHRARFPDRQFDRFLFQQIQFMILVLFKPLHQEPDVFLLHIAFLPLQVQVPG